MEKFRPRQIVQIDRELGGRLGDVPNPGEQELIPPFAPMSEEKRQALNEYKAGIIGLISYWVQHPEELAKRQAERRPWEKFYERKPDASQPQEESPLPESVK